MNDERPPSLKDVARIAGVSLGTASRALSDTDARVSAATRTRVRAVADRLAYRPDLRAQELRTGKRMTVGIIVPDISDPQFARVLLGADESLRRSGHRMLVANTWRDPRRELEEVTALVQARVSGLLFVGGGSDDDESLAHYEYRGVDVVCIGYGSNRARFPSFVADDAGALAQAVKHLADVGCRRILCLAGQEHWLVSQRRISGYRQGLEDVGQAFDPAMVLHGDFSIESGAQAVTEALDRGLQFDGVCAVNDTLAFGALQVLIAKGMHVPEDVAVVGCNDLPFASLVTPSLTSIDFDQFNIGRLAADRLLGRSTVDRYIGGFTLRVRNSSSRQERS